MWNQAGPTPAGATSHRASFTERAAVQILPCTVSQLLTAAESTSGTFTIRHRQLHQVSVVGIIRGSAPFVTNIQYCVDDMTAAPLTVKQWINTEDGPLTPGTYVKVTGSLRNFQGQRSLLAMNIRSITDLNEITSHILEVVEAHVQLFGKVFDVNMNVSAASMSGRLHSCGAGIISPSGFSTIQGEVLQAVRGLSLSLSGSDGISFDDLRTRLRHLSVTDIRSSLVFLMNEGHLFSTIDEHHFKSTDHQ